MNMPWSNPSRSVQGRKTERKLIKNRGGLVHPNSGAGPNLKDDGHDAENLYEIKDAVHTHTLNGKELDALLKRAIKQNRTARYIVVFRGTNLTADITINRGME